MGFLEVGEPYDWPESRDERVIEYVRTHGIEQFLTMWDKVKGIDHDDLKWGDEIEYGVYTLDPGAGSVRCSLRGAEILQELRRREQASPDNNDDDKGRFGCAWVPEYGSWMVEATPAKPYSAYASDLVTVERNMRLRRARLLSVLRPNEICPTVPCFPLLGVGQFTEPPTKPNGPVAKSLFIPDEAINPHPRFGALTANIRKRRGSNVDIRMPRFVDTHTPKPTRPADAPAPRSLAEADAMPEVYMDAMAFGMGCCCLQVTFQAREVSESRHLYDQLAVLTPMLLALTAATPYARGQLLDTDSRWDIISQSVDDRTPAERRPTSKNAVSTPSRASGSAPLLAAALASSPTGTTTYNDSPAAARLPGVAAPRPFPMAPASDEPEDASEKGLYHDAMAAGGSGAQHKSRYASISLYICAELAKKHPTCSAMLNDVPAPYDRAAYERLLEQGIDKMLARHVAHLFSRDPLVVFRGRTKEIDDNESTEHFENLQSTNWQTVRWKPPPPSSKLLGGDADIGWRVEFRSMEVQMTDFENAAFTVFIVLLSRVLLYFDINLYQPLSKVDENMKRAQTRDALVDQKFWFAQSLMPRGECDCPANGAQGLPVPAHSGEKAAASNGKARSKAEARKMTREKVAGLFGGELPLQQVTILQILQGMPGTSYKGLIPMILAYLDVIGTDSLTLRTVSTYLDFIVARAAGELMTPAAWMRKYIRSHPDYKFDSVVSERIAADLMAKCHRIGQGIERVPELHGAFHIEPVHAKDGYAAVLQGDMPMERTASGIERVVERYTQRSELMARKRELQAQVEEQRQKLLKAESSLSTVESQLALINGAPSPNTSVQDLVGLGRDLSR